MSELNVISSVPLVDIAVPIEDNQAAVQPQAPGNSRTGVLCCLGINLLLTGLLAGGILGYRIQRDDEALKITAEYNDLVAKNETVAAQQVAATLFAELENKSTYAVAAVACSLVSGISQVGYTAFIANSLEEPDVYGKFVRISRIATLVIGAGTLVAGGLAAAAGMTTCGAVTAAVGAIGVVSALPAPNKLDSIALKAKRCWSSMYATACSCFRS